MPGLAGNDNIIVDLATKNCYATVLSGANINAGFFLPPDIPIYSNAYVPSYWGLFGPTMTWFQDGEFSCFIRYIPLNTSTSIFGVGGYPYPGWEFIQTSDTSVFGQLGMWTVAGLNGFGCDSGYGVAGVTWSTVGFTWRGTDQRLSAYKDGVVGTMDAVFTGTPPWGQMGGGSTAAIDLWRFYGIDGSAPVTYVSHLYMWDRALQHSDMLRLSSNPMAIFTSPRPTLMMTGITMPEIPPEPPVPTVGSPGQQHILGGV